MPWGSTVSMSRGGSSIDDGVGCFLSVQSVPRLCCSSLPPLLPLLCLGVPSHLPETRSRGDHEQGSYLRR